MGAWEAPLRRSRATTRVEKAAGGVTQATWAIEQLADYFEKGGTIGGLQFLIGEEGDPNEIQATYGEHPTDVGPGKPYLTQDAKTAADHAHDPQRWCGTPNPPAPPTDALVLGYRMLEGAPEISSRLVEEGRIRVYQVTNYGQVLLDDQEQLGEYFDTELPAYLVRLTEIHTKTADRMRMSTLHAVVAERDVLE